MLVHQRVYAFFICVPIGCIPLLLVFGLLTTSPGSLIMPRVIGNARDRQQHRQGIEDLVVGSKAVASVYGEYRGIISIYIRVYIYIGIIWGCYEHYVGIIVVMRELINIEDSMDWFKRGEQLHRKPCFFPTKFGFCCTCCLVMNRFLDIDGCSVCVFFRRVQNMLN